MEEAQVYSSQTGGSQWQQMGEQEEERPPGGLGSAQVGRALPGREGLPAAPTGEWEAMTQLQEGGQCQRASVEIDRAPSLCKGLGWITGAVGPWRSWSRWQVNALRQILVRGVQGGNAGTAERSKRQVQVFRQESSASLALWQQPEGNRSWNQRGCIPDWGLTDVLYGAQPRPQALVLRRSEQQTQRA